MFKALLQLFFPDYCAGCAKPLQSFEKLLCLECRHHIPWTAHHLEPENEAFRKFYGRADVHSVQCLLYYGQKGIVRNCIHNLKYKGRQEIGILFADWLCDDPDRTKVISDAQLILPVPLHPKKRKSRGYNQVETFGRKLSERLRIDFSDAYLVRNFHGSTQTKKNLWNRSQLQETLFSVRNPSELSGKHLILIDDVLTTGATLEACIRAFHEVPDCTISILCMAFSKS